MVAVVARSENSNLYGCLAYLMEITLNGEPRFLTNDESRSAGHLIEALGLQRDRVAVVINDQVVRRAALNTTPLASGDRVEIITMVGGG